MRSRGLGWRSTRGGNPAAGFFALLSVPGRRVANPAAEPRVPQSLHSEPMVADIDS